MLFIERCGQADILEENRHLVYWIMSERNAFQFYVDYLKKKACVLIN